MLALDDVITNEALRTVVAVALSPDETILAASSFGTDTLTLFKRDAETGRLSVCDTAKDGVDGAKGLDFVVDAKFAPKGDYLYTGSAQGVGVYEVKDGKLTLVQYEPGDGKLDGIRGITISPNGEWIYVASARSGTLSVLRRDASAGTVKVQQVLSNEDGGVRCLKGVFRCCTSPDGRFVYVSSGRFGGDHAVGAFEVKPDGKLAPLHEFVNGEGEFQKFQGGNSLAISPDGKWLFALATSSDRLFRFRRNVESGKLEFVASQEVGDFVSPGSASICFSPDGQFAYVADEAASALVAFKLAR
jgi:6-phosphogluconolactonase (cycloisomerase 2 family)